MKKFLVMALVVVMALSVFAFVACSQPTYEGEYSYENTWAQGEEKEYYGVKVKVTVSDGKITKVETLADTKTFYNASEGTDYAETWSKGQAEFLKNFEGMTVEEVNAITATIKGQDGAEADKVDGIDYVTGATQSSARVILAIQNALSKIGK